MNDHTEQQLSGLDAVEGSTALPGQQATGAPRPVAVGSQDGSHDQERGLPGRLVLWTLRRFWWAVLAAGIAFGVAALAALSSLNPGYMSQARLLVGQLTGSTDSLRASASLGQTYADALGSPAVLRRVSVTAGLATATQEQMLSALEVTFNDKSRILTIQTTWPDPVKAHEVSSLMVKEVQRLRGQVPASVAVQDPTADVQAQENTRQASGVLTLIQPATMPDTKIDTHATVVAMLAAVAGSMFAFTVLCFWMGQRYRRRRRVQAAVAPGMLLGTVTSTAHRGGRHEGAAIPVARGRRAAEHARIASRIELRATPSPLRSICFVGTRGGPSAADTALNFASVMAAPGRHVTLVNPADTTHSVRLSRPQMSVVQVDSPQEESDLAERLLSHRAGQADELLVLALPSLVSAVAGPWWLSSTDAVVLVAEVGDTTVETDLSDSMDAITRRGGTLLGVILVRDGRPLARLVTPPDKVLLS